MPCTPLPTATGLSASGQCIAGTNSTLEKKNKRERKIKRNKERKKGGQEKKKAQKTLQCELTVNCQKYVAFKLSHRALKICSLLKRGGGVASSKKKLEQRRILWLLLWCIFFRLLSPASPPPFPTPFLPNPNSCTVALNLTIPIQCKTQKKEKSWRGGREISNLWELLVFNWECRAGFGLSHAFSSKHYFYSAI